MLVAAEGIKRAINSRVDLSKPPTYLGFCGTLEQQPENANGKELAKHLREVKERFLVFPFFKRTQSFIVVM